MRERERERDTPGGVGGRTMYSFMACCGHLEQEKGGGMEPCVCLPCSASMRGGPVCVGNLSRGAWKEEAALVNWPHSLSREGWTVGGMAAHPFHKLPSASRWPLPTVQSGMKVPLNVENDNSEREESEGVVVVQARP